MKKMCYKISSLYPKLLKSIFTGRPEYQSIEITPIDGISISGNGGPIKIGVFRLTQPAKTEQLTSRCIIAGSGFTGVWSFYPKLIGSEAALTSNGVVAAYAVEFPGYQASGGNPAHICLDDQKEAMKASFLNIAAQSKYQSIILVAWGMGAHAALQAAIEIKNGNHPNRIKVQLGGIAIMNPLLKGRWTREALLGKRQVEKDISRFTAELRTQTFNPFDIYPLDPKTKAEVDKRESAADAHFKPYSQNVQGHLFHQLMELDLTNTSLITQLRELNLPIFLSYGEHNPLHPPEQFEEFQKQLADSSLLTTHIIVDGMHNDFMNAGDYRFQNMIANLVSWMEAR